MAETNETEYKEPTQGRGHFCLDCRSLLEGQRLTRADHHSTHLRWGRSGDSVRLNCSAQPQMRTEIAISRVASADQRNREENATLPQVHYDSHRRVFRSSMVRGAGPAHNDGPTPSGGHGRCAVPDHAGGDFGATGCG